MNWFDYRERLGIGFDDSHMLGYFKNIMNNKLEPLYDYYDNDALRYYTNTVGLRANDYRTYTSRPLEGIIMNIAISDSITDYVSRFIVVVNSFRYGEDRNKHYRDEFLKALCDTLEQCRIQYDVYEDADGLFIFPKGVPEFDKDLVSKNLIWLSKYPETEKAWAKALRDYSLGEEPSEVADNFRKALERFFQDFFNSEKTLENLKVTYGQYLKDHNVPAEITKNLETVLQQYTNFINSNAKHHDRTSQQILEYIMYQTGNIMRLLIKLDEEDIDFLKGKPTWNRNKHSTI